MTKSYVDITENIYEITEKYPETIDLFVANGFTNFDNEMMRKTLGKAITLEDALKSKNISVELFKARLEDIIEQNRPSLDSGLVAAKSEQGGEVRVEGVLPCPIRLPLLEKLDGWLAKEGDALPFTIDYDLKAASVGVDWLKEKIATADKEDESILADVFMSAGFDLFFDKNLLGKFKANGTFKNLSGLPRLNKDFDNAELDLKDPQGQYSMLAVVPAIFMVNTEELGERSVPKSWADLLKPEFANSVALPMRDLDLFNAVLLNIYKLYGKEGIEKLANSLLYSMHPAQMVKSDRKAPEEEKPVVTILPYFFTNMIAKDSPLQAVWPADGAIISPIFLLTKKSNEEKIKPFVDFLLSQEIGELFAQQGKFPSTNPLVDNQLPKEQKFMWLGWDYINSHDIGALLQETEKIFYEAVGNNK